MSSHYGKLLPTNGWDGSVIWGTPPNVNGFRVLAALLHDTLVVGVSQTLPRWTEGATYIRQGGHHVGHLPTFLVCYWLYILWVMISNFLYVGWQWHNFFTSLATLWHAMMWVMFWEMLLNFVTSLFLVMRTFSYTNWIRFNFIWIMWEIFTT